MSEQDLHYVCWFYRPGQPKPLTEITAEVAISPRKRAQGLSRHEALHPQGGMLFLHPEGPAEQVETFHVGGVKFPFDIIFLRRDHKIGMIVHNVQPDDPGRWTYRKSAAVIETVGGFCKSHGIGIGDEVGFGQLVRAGRRAQQPHPCPGCGRQMLPGDYQNDKGECEMCDESRSSVTAQQKTCRQCEQPFADPQDSSPNGMCPSCSVDAEDRAQSSQPRESQQYNPAPGEEVIETATGRWQWMTGGPGGATYMHLDCDCPADQDGLCTCCRAHSPASTKSAFRAAICPSCGTNRAIHPVGWGGAQGLGETMHCLGCGTSGPWKSFDRFLAKRARLQPERRAVRTIADAGRRIAARTAQMQPISDVPSAEPDNDSGGAGADETRDDSWDKDAQTIKRLDEEGTCEQCYERLPGDKLLEFRDVGRGGIHSMVLCENCAQSLGAKGRRRDAQAGMDYDPAYSGGPNDCAGCGGAAEVDGPDGQPLCRACYEGRYGPMEPEAQARSHDLLRTITEA